MAIFNITSAASGADLGNYSGETKADALDAMARDAGYSSYAECCEVTGAERGDIIVTEVK